MLSLDQVIQLHISSFELVAGEEGDKLHYLYEMNLPRPYHLILHSCAEVAFADSAGARNRHLKIQGFR